MNIPKITIEDDDYIYHEDGQIFNKRLNRFLKQFTRNDGYKSLTINGKTKLVHRILYEKFIGPIKFQIDHINGVKNDNRLDNLQDISGSENCRKKGLKKTNTSGFRGVHMRRDKYIAQIEVDNKKYSKSFNTLFKAISERIRMELKYGHPAIQL